MRQLRGTVRSGKGEHARWMRTYAEVYKKETGVDLVPGTLNIELHEPWHMPATARSFSAGVTILVARCTIGGIGAFVIRTEKNERGEGDHPSNLVEVISDMRLRDALGLDDGDEIHLMLP